MRGILSLLRHRAAEKLVSGRKHGARCRALSPRGRGQRESRNKLLGVRGARGNRFSEGSPHPTELVDMWSLPSPTRGEGAIATTVLAARSVHGRIRDTSKISIIRRGCEVLPC